MSEKKQKVIVEDNAVYILDPSLAVYIKTAALCAMVGKSNQWIGQLTAQGVVNRSKTEHGSLYEAKTTLSGYCQHLEARSTKTEDEELDRERMTSENNIKKAKSVIMLMEANELQGKMHRSDDVGAMTEDLVYAIRGMLVALPGRLAVDVSNARDAAEAANIIRSEVHFILEELSKYKYDPKKYEDRVRERRRWEDRRADAIDDEV